MHTSLIFRIIIVVMLLLVVGSLFSALAFLYKDRGQGTRAVRFLTVRIVLSLALFFLMIAGFYFGLITPHGISP
ncbi:MAG: twin transmembrane helix small protein [Gammaproteobacteria bacterium]|nr:twin transmembrane helix small protein [Gammaproteobacteria bacterium]